jgi:hypothetical protein
MSVDRPDFTEATNTMSPGMLQVEGGLQFSRQAAADGLRRSWGGPSPLLRLGISDRVEFRYGTDGVVKERLRGGGVVEGHTGGTDHAFSVKTVVVREQGLRPAFSVITGISMPMGAGYYSSGGSDPFVKLCFGKDLVKGFSAAGNVNLRWDRGWENSGREGGQSLSIGHRLPGRLEGFWEVYRVSAPGDGDLVMVDGGVSRKMVGNVHLDAFVGRSVMGHTPTWVAGIGFAVRRRLVPATGL